MGVGVLVEVGVGVLVAVGVGVFVGVGVDVFVVSLHIRVATGTGSITVNSGSKMVMIAAGAPLPA